MTSERTGLSARRGHCIFRNRRLSPVFRPFRTPL